jgi:hypothetical protein
MYSHFFGSLSGCRNTVLINVPQMEFRSVSEGNEDKIDHQLEFRELEMGVIWWWWWWWW